MKSSKCRHLLQAAMLMKSRRGAHECAGTQALRTPFAEAPPCTFVDGSTDLHLSLPTDAQILTVEGLSR
jgi:hypothetical protein